MQARQARRTSRDIPPRHEQDVGTQARQARLTIRYIAPRHAQSAGRNVQTTAPNDEPDGDSEVETAKPSRTGKRDQPMPAKAQLLQAAANERNHRTVTAGEVGDTRTRL
ncbi:hypothetical protein BCR37DRAFT_391642 [Protomyces lactucae-debilis]|uniref:Uncharacterized protein n=1 Tax=Protomyces lactucae-debilis TaxID=2754530 RepID=A0A1Y2FMT6_PROLT|nr:uncharacterized protein BCR37DRAFT_391642 [Protomyces lactucae-debilis]ORY84897.1 hypothetical protein BCR37DRAFT_391642 [Protomyces lactucae-debilis]